MDVKHTSQMIRELSEQDGFELDILNTVLYGTCKNCHCL